MKKNFKFLFSLPAIALATAGFLFFILGQAYAQEKVSLTISPPTFELSANPGDSLENTIKLENSTDKSLKILAEARNFTAVGEEGSVGLTEEETPFSLASWIKITPTEAELPAKSSRIFTFRTEVPLNAEPGGHFGSIIFKTRGIRPGETGAALSQEIGALVLLQIAGKTKEEASLESFSTKKSLWEYGPVEFETRIKNTGNVHLKPVGSIIITNIFGKKIATFETERRNVLPEAIRKIAGSWDQRLLLGKYTATAIFTYGTQSKILTASTTFFGFPYKIGGVILAILLIFGIFLYRIRERLKLALKVLLGKYK